jgi:hypothetical protein
VIRSFHRRASCGLLTSYKLSRGVFGGPRDRALGIAFRLARPGGVRVEVLRRGRVLRTYRLASVRRHKTVRLRYGARRRPRGDYTVRLVATSGGTRVVARLVARRL